MNKDVAVIGGAGFLAERLSYRFIEGLVSYARYDTNVVNSSDEIINLDVESNSSLDQLDGVSAIINLAAVHRDDIRPLSRYDDVNVQGSVNVCKAARRHDINKIIFTSSVSIYGFAPADTDESGEPNYFNYYGLTKYLAEQVYKLSLIHISEPTRPY